MAHYWQLEAHSLLVMMVYKMAKRQVLIVEDQTVAHVHLVVMIMK
jgi:hypothetical protein